MDAEDIIALQNVAKRYTRAHMFRMLREREDVIREALDKISQQELENEDYALEELVARSR